MADKNNSGTDRLADQPSGRSAAPFLLDLVPDQRRDVRPAEILDGADAGRRGDVDLGELAVDHVDADEHQAALAQRRADGRADLALALASVRLSFGAPPRTMLERRSSAAGTRLTAPAIFAVDQDDALVAVLDRGQEFLHHPWLAEGDREHVVERAEIEIVPGEPEHRAAAVAVERLHHDVAVLGAERLDLGEVAGEQRRRHQCREIR